jgi:hypothetical protein
MFSIYPSKVWSKWITFKKGAPAKFKRDHWGIRGVERGQYLWVIRDLAIAGQNPALSTIVRKRPNNGPGGAALHADSQRVMESL